MDKLQLESKKTKSILRILSISILSVFILAFSLSSTGQSIPHKISYQGKLLEDGNPFTGTKTITFSIGTWEETHPSVPVTDGLYSVTLGGYDTPIPPEIFDNSSTATLTIKIGSSALSPVTDIVSVGYAFKSLYADTAHNAEKIGGQPVSDNVPDADDVLKWNGSEWVPGDDQVDDADSNPSNEIQTLSVNGSDLSISDGNTVTLPSNSSLWSQNGSNIYYSDGNVGINTDTPNSDFHVNGSVRINNLLHFGNALNYPRIYESSDDLFIQANDGNMQLDAQNNIYIGDELFVKVAGNQVGIGTSNFGSFRFAVNGSSAFWGDMELRDGSSTADVLIAMYDVGDDGVLEIRQNNSTSIRLHGNGDSYLNGGDVGIGTTSPSYKLDVTGDINFTGNLYQNGSLFSGGGDYVDLTSNQSIGGIKTFIDHAYFDDDIEAHSNLEFYHDNSDREWRIYTYNGDLKIRGYETNPKMIIYEDLEVQGNLSKGGGSFKIDHPLDPTNKYLYHSFVESPDMMNVYNGNVTTDLKGISTIKLPDYFDALNSDFRYQLTCIGVFANAIIKEKISNNEFTIMTDKPNVEVSWQITGIRKDPYANANRIQVEVEKINTEKGKYLHPKEYGFTESESVYFETENQ
jgi:hypothetical protein